MNEVQGANIAKIDHWMQAIFAMFTLGIPYQEGVNPPFSLWYCTGKVKMAKIAISVKSWVQQVERQTSCMVPAAT